MYIWGRGHIVCISEARAELTRHLANGDSNEAPSSSQWACPFHCPTHLSQGKAPHSPHSCYPHSAILIESQHTGHCGRGEWRLVWAQGGLEAACVCEDPTSLLLGRDRTRPKGLGAALSADMTGYPRAALTVTWPHTGTFIPELISQHL